MPPLAAAEAVAAAAAAAGAQASAAVEDRDSTDPGAAAADTVVETASQATTGRGGRKSFSLPWALYLRLLYRSFSSFTEKVQPV